MRLSLATARKLAISSQGLDGRWQLPKDKEGAAQAVQRLGYVQIDTIAVVQRAHHHTLWCRCPDYNPVMLDELQAVDRLVFEGWTHAASYLPMCDYRYYVRRMRAEADAPRTRAFLDGHAPLVRHVRDRIRAEGPLGSADFAAPPGKKRGSWWDWKPAKRALELLFATGELMVTGRRNFQRLYDLTERVLPAGADTAQPDRDEQTTFVVRRELSGQGISAMQHWWVRNRPAVTAVVEDLIASGEVTRVEIDGLDTEPHYALTEHLEGAVKRRRAPPRLHILSPFDGLVIWRGRVRRLFDFDYKLECYTPAAQRRYGYFCLPILWGEQFVGRLDPKADRREKTLIVRKLMFEPQFKDYDELLPGLAAKLRAFAAFNECEHTVIEDAKPRRILARMKRELLSAR